MAARRVEKGQDKPTNDDIDADIRRMLKKKHSKKKKSKDGKTLSY